MVYFVQTQEHFPDGGKIIIKIYLNIEKYDFSIVILSALYGTIDHQCDTRIKISYDKVKWYQKTKINGISIYMIKWIKLNLFRHGNINLNLPLMIQFD